MSSARDLRFLITAQDNFSGTMNKMVGQVAQLQSSVDGLNSRVKMASSSMSGFGASARQVLGGLGIAYGIYQITSALKSFGEGVIDATSKFETFMTSLNVMLRGNKGAASALNQELTQLALKSPFTLENVRTSSRQLLAFGLNPGDITKKMKMLGDVSSGAGADLSEVSLVYGKVMSMGHLTGRYLNQFLIRGIPLLEELSKNLGISKEKIIGFIKEGKIGFKDVDKALTSLTEGTGRFAGMMDEQMKTVGGKLSNLSDAWNNLKIGIGESQRGIINSTIDFVGKMIGLFNKNMDASAVMEKSFERDGIKLYNFWQEQVVGRLSNVGTWFGMKPVEGGFTDMQQYTKSMKSQMVDSSTDAVSTTKNISNLSNIIANLLSDKSGLRKAIGQGSGAFDAEGQIATIDKRVSVLKGLLQLDRDKLALLLTKGTEKKEGESEDKPSEKEAPREAITINIQNLVKELYTKSIDLKGTAAEIKHQVAMIMSEAIESVKYMRSY